MNFVRKGPGYLFLRTEKPVELKKMLTEDMKGNITNFDNALEEAGEESTITFITTSQKNKTKVEDAITIILFSNVPAIVLSSLINNQLTDIINKIDLGPGQIVMRIPDDNHQVIKEIRDFYNAKPVEINEGINQGEANDTVLSFSEKPIRDKINSLKLIKKNLIITKPPSTVLQELRRDAVRYITHGLDHSQWNELKINIYDSANMYEIQYQRLILVLADLEAGFILGENWTKDHAIALLSVIAYQIRLFTIMAPEKIKKVLLALEYNQDGKRIVDYDLYHKSRKVSWNKLIQTKTDRNKIGLKLRKSLFSKLSTNTIEKIKMLEEKICDKKL